MKHSLGWEYTLSFSAKNRVRCDFLRPDLDHNPRFLFLLFRRVDITIEMLFGIVAVSPRLFIGVGHGALSLADPILQGSIRLGYQTSEHRIGEKGVVIWLIQNIVC